MLDTGTAHGTTLGRGDDGAPRVSVRGRVHGSVRSVRTVEGWEIAAFDVGGVLVTCTGDRAADAVRALEAHADVVVVGALRARRGGCPEDDSVEVEAALVAVRRRPGRHPAGQGARRPRIAP